MKARLESINDKHFNVLNLKEQSQVVGGVTFLITLHITQSGHLVDINKDDVSD